MFGRHPSLEGRQDGSGFPGGPPAGSARTPEIRFTGTVHPPNGSRKAVFTLEVSVRTLLLILALGLTACGSDSPTAPVAVATTTTTTTTTLPPLWVRSGSGDDVFAMPTHVARARVTGDCPGFVCSFSVRLPDRFLFSVVIGTGFQSTHHEGVYVTTGTGRETVVSGSSVAWTFTEVR